MDLKIKIGRGTYNFLLSGYDSLSELAAGAMAQHGAEFDNGKIKTPGHKPYLGDLINFWDAAQDIVEHHTPNPTIQLEHMESLALIATGQMRRVELGERDGGTLLDPVVKTDLETFWQTTNRFMETVFPGQAERKD